MDPRIESVQVDENKLYVTYRDGRELSVPIAFYWRLADATSEQRQNYEISPSGRGIHWPDVDEDLSARGLLTGRPAPPPGQDQAVTVDAAAERLGVPVRTLRRTISRMEEEGFRVGEARGRYRFLSSHDLDQVTTWREEHPPGRPARRKPTPS